MAEMIPRCFYRNTELPIVKNGKKFELAIYETLRDKLSDEYLVFHSLKTKNKDNSPEIDFFIFNKNKHKVLLVEVKDQEIQGLPTQPIAFYQDSIEDLNQKLFNKADSFRNEFLNGQGEKPNTLLYFRARSAKSAPLTNLYEDFPGDYACSPDQKNIVEHVKRNFENTNLLIVDNNKLMKWLHLRWKKRIETRIGALEYDIEHAKVEAKSRFNFSILDDYRQINPQPLLIQGFAGTGKSEIIKLSIDYLFSKKVCETGFITILCWNVNLQKHYLEVYKNNKAVKVFAIEELIQQVSDGFAYEGGVEDIRIAQIDNLNAALESTTEQIFTRLNFKENETKFLFVDESQDFEHKWLLLLERIFPKKHTKWIVCFDKSQKWKPGTIDLDDLRKVIPDSYHLNLKKSLRVSESIRKKISQKLTELKMDHEGYFKPPLNSDSDSNEYLIEEKGNYSKSDLIKRLKDIISDVKFSGNLELSQIAILSSQSFDQLISNKEGAWITKKEFENEESFHGIHYDSILRSKGLEFPAVIALISKHTGRKDDLNFKYYLAASRAIVSFHCIEIESFI